MGTSRASRGRAARLSGLGSRAALRVGGGPLHCGLVHKIPFVVPSLPRTLARDARFQQLTLCSCSATSLLSCFETTPDGLSFATVFFNVSSQSSRSQSKNGVLSTAFIVRDFSLRLVFSAPKGGSVSFIRRRRPFLSPACFIINKTSALRLTCSPKQASYSSNATGLLHKTRRVHNPVLGPSQVVDPFHLSLNNLHQTK